MFGYISESRNILASNGQNTSDFDYLLFNWHNEERRGQALSVLGRKELLSGYAIGFFGCLSGFFSKLKKSIKKTKQWVGGKAKQFGTWVKTEALHDINKWNPATLIIRNAFRLLIWLNFMGLATKLYAGLVSKDEAVRRGFPSGDYDKIHKVYKKVIGMYDKMGGDKYDLDKAIKAGEGKTAIFDKKGAAKYELKGLATLGEPVTISSAFATAGTFILKVVSWLKDAGITVAKKVVAFVKNNKEDIKEIAKSALEPKNETNNENNNNDNKPIPPLQKNNSNAVLYTVFGVFSAAVVGFVGYNIYNKNSKI